MSMVEEEEPNDRLEEAKEFFKKSRQHFSQWRIDAREDYGFVSGTQWSEEDQQVLREQLRPIITFNRIQPVIDAVTGSEVSNRQEVRYIPREMGDVKVNELYTGAADWVRDQCDAEDEESDAFADTVICGIGCTETRLDYDEDPEGMIIIDRVDPLEMYPDPSSRKRNFADGKKVGRLRLLSKREVKTMWPDKADDIDGITNDPWTSADDSSPEMDVPGKDYDTPADKDDEKGKIRVFEYQYCETEAVYRVLDVDGQIKEFNSSDFKKLAQRAKKAGLPIQSVKQNRKTYKRCFFAGDVLLEEGSCPCPYSFTYKFITGKRDRNANAWFGLVRPMKDPQKWANKWLSQVLHIINSNAKGGLIAEKTAVENVRQFEETWADSSAVTWVRDGAISKGQIQPKNPITYPAGLDKLMEFAVSSIRDVTGVNLEMLGLADRQQAGVLEYQRKQAGLVILATLMDGLRRYRKEQGRLLLHYIQEYISDGRLIRIAGEDGNPQYVPLMKDPNTIKFDVIVDDAPTSPNQKEKTWAIVSQMLPMVGEMVPPNAWPEILRYSPLPESFTSKVIEAMQHAPPRPDPKAQAMEEQNKIKQQELQMKGQEQQQGMELSQQKQQFDMALAQQKQQFEMQMQEAKFTFETQMQARQLEADQHMQERRTKLDAMVKLKAKSDKDSAAQFDQPGVSDALAALTIAIDNASKPKRVVRDANNRIAGLEIERDTDTKLDQPGISDVLTALTMAIDNASKPKRVVRDGNNRIAGLEPVGNA